MNHNQQDDRLTIAEYWERSQGTDLQPNSVAPVSQNMLHWWRRSPSAYAAYLRDALCRKYIHDGERLTFLEVGAAPGRNLVKFHRDFGCTTFGVEYTDIGVKIMKDVLAANQIPPANAIHSDFFDPQFHSQYREAFDIVASFGFLEHFDRPKDVVEKHLSLLKSGGLLFITIPNFRYLNYYLKRFFGTDWIQTHNLSLMDLQNFKDCFSHESFEIHECRYLGCFQFPEPTQTKPWKRIVEKIMGKMQLLLNAVLIRLFRDKPPESRYFSGTIVCIGRKR